jgi:hypothetical protein
MSEYLQEFDNDNIGYAPNNFIISLKKQVNKIYCNDNLQKIVKGKIE